MWTGCFGPALLTVVGSACVGEVGGGAPGGAVDAGAEVDAAPPGTDAAPPLRDDALEPPPTGREIAEQVIDRETLAEGMAAGMPQGAFAYAVRVVEGAGGPAYVLYDVADGAFRRDFWPASTIKLVAALGALDYARSLGVSGAASVVYDGEGAVGTLRDLYAASIVDSSNLAYTRTVQIAGFDRLNQDFLHPGRGLGGVVLQRSYVAGVSVRSVPAMSFTEGDVEAVAPARSSDTDYGCTSDGRPDGNCADLFELVGALRRVVLDAEIPAAERFDLAPADVAGLRAALCASRSDLEVGAERVLGPVTACTKTGRVPSAGYHYLDHGLLEVEETGERFLIGAVVPWGVACESDTACRAALADIGEQVALVLASESGGVPIQPDGGVPVTVQIDPDAIAIEADGASRVEVYAGGELLGSAEGGPRFAIPQPPGAPEERLLTVRAFAGATPIGHRAARFLLGAR